LQKLQTYNIDIDTIGFI